MATQPGLSLLVPGGTGQLGSDLAARSGEDVDVFAPNSSDLDITVTGEVVRVVTDFARRARAAGRQPVMVNAAAYTAVDAAEDDEERAFAVNADGPRVLAAACSARNVPMVHVSTDYVFSGEALQPYEPDDALGPASAYGRTKAAGENAVLGSGAAAWVVRTSWVYGAQRNNFVRTIARLQREKEIVSVVDDQHGCPTWTADLAAGLVELAARIASGAAPGHRTLHCTGAGETTWFSFACAIFSALGADPARVRPCRTADMPRRAPRPSYSVLSNDSWRRAGLTPLRSWQEALTEFVAGHGETLLPEPPGQETNWAH